jgi:hypothetical protein
MTAFLVPEMVTISLLGWRKCSKHTGRQGDFGLVPCTEMQQHVKTTAMPTV